MNNAHIKAVVFGHAGVDVQENQAPVFSGGLLTGAEATFSQNSLLNFQVLGGLLPYQTTKTTNRPTDHPPSQFDPTFDTTTTSTSTSTTIPVYLLLSWQPSLWDSRLHAGPSLGGLWTQDTSQFAYGLSGDVGLTKPTKKRGSVLSLSAQYLRSKDASILTAGFTFRIPVHTFGIPEHAEIEPEIPPPETAGPATALANVVLDAFSDVDDADDLNGTALDEKPVGEERPPDEVILEDPSTTDYGTPAVGDGGFRDPVHPEPDEPRMPPVALDRDAVDAAGVLGTSRLDAAAHGGIGNLIGAQGTQSGSGGLGGHSSGLGGGGTTEGLGGLGTSSGRQKMAPSTLPQFTYDPSRYKGATPRESSREPVVDPLTDAGSDILMDRIQKTFLENQAEGKAGRIQELWSRVIVNRNPSAKCDITVHLSVTANGRPDEIHIQLNYISGVLEADTALLEEFEQNVGDLIFSELRFPPLTTPIEEDNQLFFQYTLVGQE